MRTKVLLDEGTRDLARLYPDRSAVTGYDCARELIVEPPLVRFGAGMNFFFARSGRPRARPAS